VPVGDEVVIDDDTMRRALEAILMVTDEPLPVLTLARAVGRPTGDVAAALETLAGEYAEQQRGFDLREVGGGWRYYTRPEAAPYVERFVLDGQQARLTQAALETLAVVAYKQPVSRARVSAIRGVNVDGVMRTLIARGLVEEAGADTESQATLYRTTSYFLERMGMQSLDDLPELAPYLPEMDDIEEELAAQTLPTAEGSADLSTTSDESTTPTEPSAQSPDETSAPNDPTESTGIDGDLTTNEPANLDVEHEPGDLKPSDEFDPTDEPTAEADAHNGAADDAAADVAGDEPAEADTGIDGDLATDEPVDLDVEHEPGHLEPSDEFDPADTPAGETAEAEQTHDSDVVGSGDSRRNG
jgi:segregation and condensation protein B